jgi:hypothetical protein
MANNDPQRVMPISLLWLSRLRIGTTDVPQLHTLH